jgi:predicted nucleic acid-binding protein
MPNFYLDSSALAKKYIVELGTARVLDLFRRGTGNSIYVAQITGVEVISAISRRLRGASLSPDVAQKAVRRLRRDLSDRLLTIRISDKIIADAMRLSETHGLRAYDAVQLATANELENRTSLGAVSSIVFVSADERLNQVASATGLIVQDPNAIP